MKYLKNPVIAVFLSAIIILSSSFLSARIKLSKASDKVTAGFYQGLQFGGYKRKSIASQLENICGAVSGLTTIAKNYGVDCKEVTALNKELSNRLFSEYGAVSSIYSGYTALREALPPMLDALSGMKLSNRDEKGAKDYMVTIMDAQKVIEESGYNESVREFSKDMSRFPADFFLSLTRTKLPQIFG